MERRKVRIVLAKLGLDDHARPLYVLAKAFRDAGMEVIFLGPFQTPESVVNAAIAEGAEAIGLSLHTMSYIGWVAEVMDVLREKGAGGISVFVGGVLPEEDRPELEQIGVKGFFRPGTPLTTITDHIIGTVEKSRT